MRKPYLLAVLVLLTACAAFTGGQKVATPIPCIGSVGLTKSTLFTKEFVKIGAPDLTAPIGVHVQSVEFNRASFTAYKKFRAAQGKEVTLQYADSLETQARFFQLRIADLVQLKEQFNAERNQAVKAYIMQDRQHSLLSGISFVTDDATAQELQNAAHFYVTTHHGELRLEAKNRLGKMIIPMAVLQVFDFDTSGFCWKNNRYGQPEIAVIVPKGSACPPDLEKDALKIDDTRAYLKLRP